MKIHRFEKHASRPKGAPRREREASTHDHPTLPEFSLEPFMGGAAAPPPALKPPSRHKESASSAGGSTGAGLSSGLLSERLATARQLFAQGQLTQARSMLEKLVSLGVGGAPVRTLLGTLYMAQGASERALACFEEALEEDPSDLSARLYRGEVRLGWGDLLLAQEDMDYVLESGTAGSPLVQQARRLLQRIDELRERKRR